MLNQFNLKWVWFHSTELNIDLTNICLGSTRHNLDLIWTLLQPKMCGFNLTYFDLSLTQPNFTLYDLVLTDLLWLGLNLI